MGDRGRVSAKERRREVLLLPRASNLGCESMCEKKTRTSFCGSPIVCVHRVICQPSYLGLSYILPSQCGINTSTEA